jgi:hypothetical protein
MLALQKSPGLAAIHLNLPGGNAQHVGRSDPLCRFLKADIVGVRESRGHGKCSPSAFLIGLLAIPTKSSFGEQGGGPLVEGC